MTQITLIIADIKKIRVNPRHPCYQRSMKKTMNKSS